ncbi:hypothetical protein NQT74_17700 [Alteromonas stellipolaris]|uniref:hypothetical protein n=1 Tax=Alteromonas stellipolaris TaxID=233316 RepID=UPI0021197E5B|nr:hypothetical protein [Alteromonas stellipolaris]MCQ8850418.1 hypothetical protein [Alteromonas stellipolaris]
MIKFLKGSSDKFRLPKVKNIKKNYDVVIHIGAPKTGSSALQKFFVENATTLNKLGFYYPEHKLDENGVSGGHSDLALKLIDKKDDEAKKQFDALMQKAKKADKVLFLSSEAFYIRPQAVASLVKGLRCKIISFFRDPIEAINSNYNQGIKRNFSTASPEQFCSRLLREHTSFYTGLIFNQWIQSFNKDDVDVYGYDATLFKQFPIQEVFLNSLGVSSKEISAHFNIENKVVNRSYSYTALELKRLLNHALDQKAHHFNHQLDWFLQGISDKSEDQSIELSALVEAPTLEKLEQHFREKTQQCLEKVLVKINPSFLQPPAKVDKSSLPHKAVTFCKMFEIIEVLKDEKPDLYTHLESQVSVQLKNNTIGADASKLADLFNIEYRKASDSSPWFSNAIMTKMPEFKLEDFLREIAYVAYERGEAKHAQALIEKAREIRPKGPFIVKFSDKLRAELGSYSQITK